jgi:hypothetical protein
VDLRGWKVNLAFFGGGTWLFSAAESIYFGALDVSEDMTRQV